MPADDVAEVGLRFLLEQLAAVRDLVIAYHEGAGFEPSTSGMFVSDAKEGYYRSLLAVELLARGEVGGQELLARLAGARATALQVASELVASFVEPRRQDEGRGLRDRWLAAFEALSTQVEAAARRKLARPPAAAGLPRVRVVSPEHLELICSVCGVAAVTFSVGTSSWVKERSLLYGGITHGRACPLAHAPELLRLLTAGDLAEVHRQLMARGLNEEGIDGYCPTCDLVLCHAHYNVSEAYDDGFYDCSHGVCPAGHRRMIDD